MANKGRVFGRNMYYYMIEKKISPEELAGRLGYLVEEIRKIFDARLFVDRLEKKDIAEALGVSLEDLLDEKKIIPQDSRSLIEYRGEFSKEENKEHILDLFDMYCDIQELLIREGIKPSL